MHELAVCQAIVAQVEQIAQERNARVHSIVLRIGPLSGVEAELLLRAYPLASAGSRSAAASLIIESAPVRVSCRGCGRQTHARANRLVCSDCGDWHTDLIGGDELLLASVDLISATVIENAGNASSAGVACEAVQSSEVA
jgi:hydrogenase nickel incorporation protein HypA/HybF